MTITDARDFGRLFDLPEEGIDLGRAAFVMARIEYPDLDLDAQVARLDELAKNARPLVRSQDDWAGRLAALRVYLTDVCGFRGNEQDYYNPKNSFLNEVLDRRTGIPITLSVVYMEVGHRLGLSLHGVGLPGHFLIRYDIPEHVLFLDPFHGGRSMTADDCRRIVAEMYDGEIEFQQDYLAAVNKRYILLRMLNNLRGVYIERRQFRKALAVVEMILAISPASADDIKNRGVLHYRLRQYRQSRQDLENYLFLSPQAPDAQEIQEILRELRRLTAMLN